MRFYRRSGGTLCVYSDGFLLFLAYSTTLTREAFYLIASSGVFVDIYGANFWLISKSLFFYLKYFKLWIC